LSNGRHLILDLYGCDPQLLDDYDFLKGVMERALELSNATVVRVIGEKFSPQGVTLLALLSESHCSIHTWPEVGYAAIDLYTCGEKTDSNRAANFFQEQLCSDITKKQELIRSIQP
jgi:S-adenosylmethionine decarboxylase